MHKSARQSMAWLHSWLGLLLGWLLFCIFLTGTFSYYRQEINVWSQPILATIEVNQKETIQQTFEYLQKNAHDAKSWFIQVANQDNPVNRIYWQKPDGSYEGKTLDPNTGKELNLTQEPAGDFFYAFHFQLFGIPYYVGRLIVCFAAFIMLISLISGIITHKKIFTDFFTLRTFKGPRSYLDFHNVTSVIALPFFLIITFTGLAIFFYLYLPQGIEKLYAKDRFQYFEEINNQPSLQKTTSIPTTMLDIQQIQNRVTPHLGAGEIANINVKNPNTTTSTITFIALQDNSISRNAPQITLNASTGEIQQNMKNTSAIATLNASVYGLHMAKFAQPFLRFGLFISGILGCLMIASGLLLWSLKRQIQYPSNTFHLGYFLVDRLNIATLIGLPIATICYFLTNRISLIYSLHNLEITVFFSIWSACFLLALIIKTQKLWSTFLKLFIVVSSLLLIINWIYLIRDLPIDHFSHYWKFIRFDLFILLFILSAIFIHQKITPIRNKTLAKIKAKRKVAQQDIES
ncbi:peptidase [Acinetobacter sp. ANC 4558]|uniref:PepSY-associated TM helix domain-containing protein n=1 Tax=Acinetobacter sp. ANC 4558 TaxID=1977876 RepID=UPI000A345010|nr:PepSY-associated TM helix domain-containing protein [Acinetobacter sp. ANC 4558]OTG80780.1 peptidase [Acinetobacter sp. ANC 4558]